MDNREAVNWLINISADIGKAEHSDLWHYEQALTEIKDMLESAQPEERTAKRTETRACDSIGRKVAIDAVDAIGHIATMPDGDKCIRRSAVKYTLSMLPPAEPEHEWIPVIERLPENADHPGALCPRYQVTTPYGVTEGWYRPHDHEKGGQWYALFWFMSHIYEIWNIDFERGDVPKIVSEAPVTAWRPFPEAYKEVGNERTD